MSYSHSLRSRTGRLLWQVAAAEGLDRPASPPGEHQETSSAAATVEAPRCWMRLASGCVALLGYLALAVALTWPLATAMRTTLPLGTEHVASVPLLNAWTIWWNANRLRHGFADYWNAPIFAPHENVFAFSEAQPTTLLVAPLVDAGGPALAYNVYLLVLLSLNGLTAYLVFRRIGLALLPAFLGGVLLESLPIVHWQLGVLQLVAICGPLWVIERIAALRDRPTLPRALWLGLAAALAYAACNYWGLFLSVLLPLSCWPLLWGRFRCLRFWCYLAGAIVLAGVLASPILWAQVEAMQQYSWSRELSLLKQLSAHPGDYLNPPWHQFSLGWPAEAVERRLWHLGTGTLLVVAAALGAVAGLFVRNLRRWVLFFLLFGGVAFGLSLGPWATIPDSWIRFDSWPAAPYRWLMAIHPGLEIARSPFRFAFFVQIALGGLAGLLLEEIRRGLGRLIVPLRGRPRIFARIAASLLLLVTGGAIAAETWPPRQPLATVPDINTDWVGWLRRHGDPSRPVLCLPFPNGTSVAHYEQAAQFMYFQTAHHRPLAGGYTGFFPDGHIDLRYRMRAFPNPRVLQELRARGVEFIVATTPATALRAYRSDRLRPAYRDQETDVLIFRLLPPRPET